MIYTRRYSQNLDYTKANSARNTLPAEVSSAGYLEGSRMYKVERIFNVLALAFGIIYTIASLKLPRAPVGDPMGPIYFPLGLGIFMAVLGALMLITSKKDDSARHENFQKKNFTIVIIIVALGIAYSFLFNKLGFIASTLLFLLALLFLINGPKSWLKNILISVIFTVGIWLLFERVFLITLP